jgi:hypothetical protein
MKQESEVRPGDLVMCWKCERRGLLIKGRGTLEQHYPTKGRKVCPASGQKWPIEPPDGPAVLEHLS